MSDIVERLRNDASEGRFHNPTNPHSIFWDEIADEIERLRSLLAEVERERDAYRDAATARDTNEDSLRSRLAEATELLARAEDDLSEWERIHGSDPQTTRLRLEITGFMAVPAVSERWCECGERLSGHEDESSTSCRWCVTGWRRSNGDQADSATHRENERE